MPTLFRGARKLDAGGVVENFWMLIDGAFVTAVGLGDDHPTVDDVVEVSGDWLTPGFVDLHVHGGGGGSVDDGIEGIRSTVAEHRAHGTTRSVVSLVTAPFGQLERSLRAIAALDDDLILGAHLEGPFLAEARRGAHSAEFLRAPTLNDAERLLTAADGSLRQITIAPELPGALQMIGVFVDADVVVAVGHTEATATIARAAFDAGARLLTHAFNAMPGIHHRAPGPISAALRDERVTLELILDGVHVHPDVAALTFAAAPQRIALVTDAMAATGAGDGNYRLGALEVTVDEGRARVAGTDTIAGSTLTQDAALRIALSAGVDPVATITALTLTPARVLGEHLGLLAPGYPADAVRFDAQWTVKSVWANGVRI